MSSPLLTVVIPTCARPQYLPRAINSALAAAGDGDVEVVVVPNGPSESWKSVTSEFSDDPRVRWVPLPTPNANLARNAGLESAAGEFIRFLDDDDYLYPTPCAEQLQLLIDSGSDVCSGHVDVVLEDLTIRRVYRQPETTDLVVSTLTPDRMTLPTGHLYRRSSLRGARWDPERAIRQDTAWLIELAASRELAWERYDGSVGAWVQHRGSRISRGRDPGPKALRETSELIQAAYSALAEANRLTPERSRAAAEGLWASLQKGLQYDFRYWRRVAEIADSYAPSRRPPSAIHRIPVIRSLPPLMVESMLVPARVLYRPVRRALERRLLLHV